MTREVARLLVKGAAFLILNGSLALLLLYVHESTLPTEAWKTDSVLLTMPQDAQVNVAVLGTSRAYVFSRFKEHHEAMEGGLGRTVFNMALPQGGGVRPARFLLETFWEQGNRADRVVYFLDPFTLYSVGANENHKFVYFEPLRLRFLAKLLRNGYNYRRTITYIRSKLSRAWLTQQPEPLIHHTWKLEEEKYTAENIRIRLASLYPDGLPEDVFATYTAELERIVALCEAHETPLTVVLPPTVLGHEPGHDATMAWLNNLAEHHNFPVYDWVNAMPDHELYYNLDHMNLGGVSAFMTQWVRPTLDKLEKEPTR